MRVSRLLAGAALTLCSALALAQNAPQSLLPPGFDDPAPAPAPAPAPSGRAPAVTSSSSPASGSSSGSTAVVQPLPSGLPSAGASVPGLPVDPSVLAKLPTLEELEKMTPEELEQALGLTPEFDISSGVRRSMEQVGLIDEREGGFAPNSLSSQRPSLIRAALAGNKGVMVSRWGHIMLRRALASRMDAPRGMNPADFAGLRAALLLRMGEAESARAMVQDVDTGNWTPTLNNAAFNAYVANGDFTGICPGMLTRGALRSDPQWEVAGLICRAFRGEDRYALQQLDRALRRGKLPAIDVLLAQKYAGAAGKVRRAVTIEWDNVDELTPWRYGLALAVGLEPPERLMKAAGSRYAGITAVAPMLGLESRAAAADRAAAAGVLSGAAMVDLYGQMFSDPDVTGEWSERAEDLRRAYVLASRAGRVTAMQKLWDGGEDADARYSRQVLTASAAARMPVDADLAESASLLVASMLSAGFDGNAARWAGVAPAGSEGWALIALSSPNAGGTVDDGALDTFVEEDGSPDSRKAAFLVAGLAGLGRISDGTRDSYGDQLGIDFNRQSRWSRMIRSAAQVDNPALVALLAGLGMQGTGWDKMTPRYLYTIVSTLRQVGLEAEARMIAAEAVTRA